MYARYVPPSKGGQASHASPSASQLPPPEPAFAPVIAAPPADGYSYARYVPSSKPAKKAVETSQVQFFDDEPTSPTPKRKRDVADEPREAPQPDSKKPKNSTGHEVEESESAQQVSENKAKNQKKKGRRSKRRTAASDTEEEDDASEPEPESRKPEEPPVAEDEDKKAKKTKKDKKEKKAKKPQNDEALETPAAETEVDLEAEDVSMVDAEDNSSAANTSSEPIEVATVTEETEKKKKRDKKKKPKEHIPTEEESGSKDADADKRHKAVLDRKSKSLKLASEAVPEAVDPDAVELGELHGLEPLPQPELVNLNTAGLSYETLPPWLAEPIRVSQDTRTPFTDLGLLPKAARVLEEKGYKDAFAVQTAALPLLLPTSKQRPGDVLISAATGSGKTLAYALPIVRDISQGLVTRLRALVVLPTRELVTQAQEVFELCAKAYEGGDRKRVRIGITIGSQSLKNEQETLIDRETRYDPETYKQVQEQIQVRRQQGDGLVDPDSDETDPRLSSMDGHIVDFSSKVDVLICTPGRLVEHMEQTPGFSLDYVRWLVVDEADKILAQSFQGWLELVMAKFRLNKFSARDFPDMDLTGVRKVILSATLTRDLSLLSQLSLRSPRLIVLESDSNAQIAEHSLPALLREYAVRVHDTNLKPLYLLELLQGQHMLAAKPSKEEAAPAKSDEASETSSDSDSSSDATSDAEADSDTSSDSTSDSDSDSDSASGAPSVPRSRKLNIPVSLIFTKSNESALRLSRLIALLDPSLAPHIGTLTSTTPTHIRRKTLRAFATPTSTVRLLIASDLVARGIDLPNLDHVINYDLPPSVAGYIHRVGRTARAGRSGCAWTLVGDDESGWFWGKIAKGAGVRRAQKFERTRIEEMSEERVQEYEIALEKLGKEVGR
ncbi:hypothetical protein G7046_g1717 [Stylonectria norvegica]|nr:hypothetical protein G7046_g1717 [Stylonectria norvegica]